MLETQDIPKVAVVRVLSGGGPYTAGEMLSVAFSSAGIGRLASHTQIEPSPPPSDGTPIVPESVSAIVTGAAGQYKCGDLLTFWFVDPSIARIQVDVGAGSPATEAKMLNDPGVRHPVKPLHQDSARSMSGILLRLDWRTERVRRFVQVVDKLFTVDRLGWYRHVFAMRLLVPDVVSCGDAIADVEAMRHLHALRTALTETLGRPLLTAFMPGFFVSQEWLDSIDSPAVARALSGLRDSLLASTGDGGESVVCEREPDWTIGIIERTELRSAHVSCAETLLPLLIATASPFAELSERLCDYRETLIELFGATSQSGKEVHLNQMAQANPVLDDRLWQLVGALNKTVGAPAGA